MRHVARQCLYKNKKKNKINAEKALNLKTISVNLKAIYIGWLRFYVCNLVFLRTINLLYIFIIITILRGRIINKTSSISIIIFSS